MAEALAKADYGKKIFVDSVGVRDGVLDPMAVVVMDEIGIDLSHHKPKRLGELMDTSFEVIVTLSPEAQDMAVKLNSVNATEVEYWPTPDPSLMEGNRNERLAGYRDLREYLTRCLKKRFTLHAL